MILIFQLQLLLGCVSSASGAQNPAFIANLYGDPIDILVKRIKEELPPGFIILNKVLPQGYCKLKGITSLDPHRT